MFLSILLAGPFAALAYAQSNSVTETKTVAGNPFTSFLTQTNSLGVVTGQPSPVLTQPSLITSQPALATVPAGLPAGINTVPNGNSSTFLVSVGSSTTVVISSTSTQTATGTSSKGTGSSSTSASASATSSGAASSIKAASGALFGAAAFFAAFL